MVLFATSSSYFYWYKQQQQQVCLSLSIFSVKGKQVSVSRCRYSTFIQSPPAIKQKQHLNDSFFPSKATVTGCYLLDLQSAGCLCSRLTDWLAVFGLSPCLSLLLAYLIACLPACISVSICSWIHWKWTFFKGPVKVALYEADTRRLEKERDANIEEESVKHSSRLLSKNYH